MKNKLRFFFTICLLIIAMKGYSQVELVPVSHPVYDFLKRMDLEGIIPDYNSSILPISRQKVANYLRTISDVSMKGLRSEDKIKNSLSPVDKKILSDYEVEFGYELKGNLNKSSVSIFNGGNASDNDKQKYLYSYADSNATLFWDLTAWVSQRSSDGDSVGNNSIGLGDIGFSFRGTLLGSIGYYLRFSNGQRFRGNDKDVDFARVTNPKWNANLKMKTDNGNFDTYEGYVRYATKNEVLALTAGKEQMLAGFGYIDKLFLAGNTTPYSFIRLDAGYKSLQYFFVYGSLRGDSLGVETYSKYIATHRLNVNLHRNLKIGFFESLIISNRPFNFTYLNPFSFLRSADYNAGDIQSDLNNALIGIDVEVKPYRKVALQTSLLIDDLNFGTIFSNKTKYDNVANDNRFGWQFGAIWTDGFLIPNLTAVLEYTRVNPFVYTHRTDKSQYTNWALPIGHNLAPNSDEIALKLNYDITNRLNVKFLYQHQRHGEGFVYSGDTLKINYGGTIGRGEKDVVIDNTFLQGNRTDTDIFTTTIVWQPLRQYFLEGTLVLRNFNLLYSGKKKSDAYFWVNMRVDL